MMTLTPRRPLRTALATSGAALTLAGLGVLTSGAAQAADTGIPVLEAIKVCESGGDYTAQNPTSTASGAYQFLDSTWQSMDAAAGYSRAADAPESVQDAAAIELYTEQGTTPWLASYSCWSDSGSLTTGSGESSTATSSGTSTETSSGTSTGAASGRSTEASASDSSAEDAPTVPEGTVPDRSGQDRPSRDQARGAAPADEQPPAGDGQPPAGPGGAGGPAGGAAGGGGGPAGGCAA